MGKTTLFLWYPSNTNFSKSKIGFSYSSVSFKKADLYEYPPVEKSIPFHLVNSSFLKSTSNGVSGNKVFFVKFFSIHWPSTVFLVKSIILIHFNLLIISDLKLFLVKLINPGPSALNIIKYLGNLPLVKYIGAKNSNSSL